MKEKIIKYLSDIEEKHEIEILLACETGSRAWGFPSPDSDYDVRLIYKHKKNWYLSLKDEKDSIELMLDNNLIDISGWDLKKSLQLLWKSNSSLLERIQSSIIYKCDEDFLMEINSLADSTYSRISTIHHYLSMAKNCLSEIDDIENYKLKKLFYALRAIIACKWIMEKTEKPPISFIKMLNELNLNIDIKEQINTLIGLKSHKDESYYHSGEKELFLFINDILEEAEETAKTLTAGKGDFDKLNNFFIRIINC